MKKAIFGTILILLFGKNVCLASSSPKSRRFITFNSLESNIQITATSGYVITTIKTQNRLQCADMCLQKLECKSYSFCQRFCYLNSIGLHELLRNEHHAWFTASDQNCHLQNMNRNFVPECEEFGTKRSIRNDSDPNYCNINKKRVDGSFLAREYFNASIDSPEEFKGFTTRKCLPETAINGGFCKNENETEAVWVKWNYVIGNFTNALQSCEKIGGLLYPDLVGDGEQIEFLKKYSNKQMWLGVTVDTEWYLWKNLRGEYMKPDRMRWFHHRHKQLADVARTALRDPYITMTASHHGGRAVCQMLV